MMVKKSSTKTEKILIIMHILAWVAFIGLTIKAGAILVSYGVSWFNPAAAGDLYPGLDLHDLMQFSFLNYTLSVLFIIGSLCMQAIVVLMVIRALALVNLLNPFIIDVARILEKISFVLFGIWLIAILNNAHSTWLTNKSGIHIDEWAMGGFFFVAGLMFIISQIFKRGVEIQTENELTV